MHSKTGILYIVATPIGNFADISPRALETLSRVALILAEDTRHSGKLLAHYGIHTPVRACHEHNEQHIVARIINQLQAGTDIALISDAGTPLISDPGYRLVKAARAQNLTVSPIPGSSAVIAALSVSGLPVDRFLFDGFLPAKGPRRQARLQALRHIGCTVVFYESNHRISESLTDMQQIFGATTEICVGREITKKFESFYTGPIATVIETIATATEHHKGEFVIVLSPPPMEDTDLHRAQELTRLLAQELPLKTAAKIAAQTFGVSSNACYRAGVRF